VRCLAACVPGCAQLVRCHPWHQRSMDAPQGPSPIASGLSAEESVVRSSHNNEVPPFQLFVISCDRRLVKRVDHLLSGSSWRAFERRHSDDLDAALRTLSRKPAELVLLDLELPGDRGMQTLVKLRQALSRVPVIALTDSSDVGRGVLALRHGAQDCIPRMRLKEAALTRSIRFAVERQRREQSLCEYIRELNATQGQLHALLQTNADGHVVVDEEGAILYANPAAELLFGRDEADLRGSSFGFPVAGQDLELIDIFRKGESVTVEMRVARSRWNGESAFVVSLRDVSARRPTEGGGAHTSLPQADLPDSAPHDGSEDGGLELTEHYQLGNDGT